MEIDADRTYLITIRMPWGDLKRFEAKGLVRAQDGTIAWPPQGCEGLEAYLDCIIDEREEYVLGWLGGSCDATVVVSLDDGAPVP